MAINFKVYDICWIADEGEESELPYEENVSVYADEYEDAEEKALIKLCDKYEHDIENCRVEII